MMFNIDHFLFGKNATVLVQRPTTELIQDGCRLHHRGEAKTPPPGVHYRTLKVARLANTAIPSGASDDMGCPDRAGVGHDKEAVTV